MCGRLFGRLLGHVWGILRVAPKGFLVVLGDKAINLSDRYTQSFGYSIVWKKSRNFGQMFGIRDCFRLDFRGFVGDLGGDIWRSVGGVLIYVQYSVGGFLGGF